MINFGLFSTISLANRQAVCYDISSQLGAFNFSAPKKKLEENIMIEKIRAMKNKKGFTLVELIVVLVILAILAALLVPALTGYIDKAQEEKATAECRMVVMAAQTEASTAYGSLSGTITADAIKTAMKTANIDKYAEVKGKYAVEVNAQGQITKVTYSNAGYTCVYADKAYTVTKDGAAGAATKIETSVINVATTKTSDS